MDHDEIYKIIDKQINDLEEIRFRNTVLIPGVLAGIATLKELKRRIGEALDGKVIASAGETSLD